MKGTMGSLGFPGEMIRDTGAAGSNPAASTLGTDAGSPYDGGLLVFPLHKTEMNQ